MKLFRNELSEWQISIRNFVLIQFDKKRPFSVSLSENCENSIWILNTLWNNLYVSVEEKEQIQF